MLLVNVHSYTLCFVGAAFLGFSDCMNQSIIQILISDKFGSQVEPFAVFKLM